jgi:hypothetical protein
MRVASSFIVSLVLTATVSFALPVLTIGLVFGLAILICLIPGLTVFGHQAIDAILDFLAVFGTGKPVTGVVTLGLASTVVGVLFDLFNIYCYQSLRDYTVSHVLTGDEGSK